MKKRVLVFILAACASLALYGCDGGTVGSASNPNATASSGEESKEEAQKEEKKEEPEKEDSAKEDSGKEDTGSEEDTSSKEDGKDADYVSKEQKNPADVDESSDVEGLQMGSGNPSIYKDAEVISTDDASYGAPLDNSSIGPVLFLPNTDSTTNLLPRGGKLLHAYFKRSGVKGNGKIYIHSGSNDDVIDSIDLSRAANCYEGPDDGTFKLLNWENGTHLVIEVSHRFENSGNFYVLAGEGAFASSDGSIRSKAISDDTLWRFDVQDFGVEFTKGYGRNVFINEEEVYARILLRAPAKKVLIEGFDENRLGFNESEFRDGDDDLRIRVKQLGEDPFYINFYNKERELIASIPMMYVGVLKPTEEEQTTRQNVIGL